MKMSAVFCAPCREKEKDKKNVLWTNKLPAMQPIRKTAAFSFLFLPAKKIFDKLKEPIVKYAWYSNEYFAAKTFRRANSWACFRN